MLNEQMLNEKSGTRAAQAAERREQILVAGLDEFCELGYHGASTRQIAERIGVSSGLIFNYFPNKQALYEELVLRALGHVDLGWDEASDEPIEFLTAQVARILGLLASGRDSARLFQFVAYAQWHPGISERVDAAFVAHDIIAQTVPIIEAGQRAGSVRSGDLTTLAVALWSALQGMAEEISVRKLEQLPEPEWLIDIIRAPRAPRP